ncbi:Fe-S cluster assembly protein SufD [Leptothoe kymatousa]|uniref:Fe-S cluster assembly protein SufD n=1 Tax=Leptothoe kymatousa TAU-MAC 1615 TaxID=2364775 RepID=A0ABS5Y2H5_9CYAN|nr:Fe-S cluster assembly protein SufD [Leptothoe kymatousa]MBT9311564.1 Fe-S cluster assembly protein SufD [Leptothoe kymatousa TAU-MAC 1615]
MSATSTAVVQRDRYLADLLNQATLAAEGSSLSLASLRATARALVQERTFPSNRDEEWRFTDLSSMLAVPFQAAPTMDGATLAQATDLLQTLTLGEASGRVVFVNGTYAQDLSTLPPAVQVLSQTGTLPDELGQIQGGNEVFTALNTAGFTDAAIVRIGKNSVLEQPLQLIYLTMGHQLLVQPRCLVIAESGSAATLVEEFHGVGASFTNSVSEIWVHDNAEITHLRLQQESTEAVHIGKTAISQARDSRYRNTTLNFGASISRHNIEVYQTGTQTETTLNGLTAIGDKQLADTHSLVALNHPHGVANQLQKNIMDDRSHGVFNGKVYVPQQAQLTNASQLNRNLLLSPKSRVDTKPELDIVADDVKCAHGATVSQLAPDELFYLQSRGINRDQAQRLLIYAFAMEMIEPLSVASLRERMTQYIQQWTV